MYLICYALDDISGRLFVPDKTKDVNVRKINMTTIMEQQKISI